MKKRIRANARRIGAPSSARGCGLLAAVLLLGLLAPSSVVLLLVGVGVGVQLVRADCPPDRDCGPYGVCIMDSRSCGNDCQEKCKCDPGYFGPDCSYQAEICPSSILGANDSAQECLNGGTCYPVTQLSGGSAGASGGAGAADAVEVYYLCDCRKAYGDAGNVIYAGHQCEYPAQKSCEVGVASSSYAFCVNGGTCQSVVPSGSPSPNCTCPEGFVGRHCQYAYGTAPSQELDYSPPSSANSGNPLRPVAIFFLVLLAASFVLGVSLFAWRRQRQRDLADRVESNLSSMGSPDERGGGGARPSSPSAPGGGGGPAAAPHDLYLRDDDDDDDDEKEVASSPEWTRSARNDDRDALQPPEREII